MPMSDEQREQFRGKVLGFLYKIARPKPKHVDSERIYYELEEKKEEKNDN